MLVVAPDPELGALPDVLLLGKVPHRGVVDAHVKEVYASCVLTVITPHVGPGPVGLEYHGDAVEFRMARVEDVAAHALDRRAAIPVERASEIRGDRLRRPAFDLMPVDEVHHLAIPQ
jgi:hypothetical protein